ncbi:hypothetical protein C8F01DRAFT_1012000, partial [Mycena amicta]
MRKTSYALTALAVALCTVLTVVSLTRIDWIVAKYQSDIFNSTFQANYGLSELCTNLVVKFPGRGGSRYEDPQCRAFPTRENDNCDEENRFFCAMWSSARYAVEVAIGFGALALIAIAFGVSTHSRRRRIWRAVAGLVVVQALLQLVAFAIVVDQFRTARLPTFEDARLGPGLWLVSVAWVCGILITLATVVTGVAADRGKRWAAGNRAYQPI